MCLIAVLPAGVVLSKEQVKDAMIYNPDGVGIMHANPDGSLHVRRHVHMKPSRTHVWLNRAPSTVERIVHFRKATRGEVSLHNVHPFIVRNRFGVMHNGTLSDDLAPMDSRKGKSDTAYFVERHMEHLSNRLLTRASTWELFDAAAGANRIVMLDAVTGITYFTSREDWKDGKDGMLLSNAYAVTDRELWGLPPKPTPLPRTTHASALDTDYHYGYGRSFGTGGGWTGTSSAGLNASNTSSSKSETAPATDEEVVTHMSTFLAGSKHDGVPVPWSSRAPLHRMFKSVQAIYNEYGMMVGYTSDAYRSTSSATLLLAFLYFGIGPADLCEIGVPTAAAYIAKFKQVYAEAVSLAAFKVQFLSILQTRKEMKQQQQQASTNLTPALTMQA